MRNKQKTETQKRRDSPRKGEIWRARASSGNHEKRNDKFSREEKVDEMSKRAAKRLRDGKRWEAVSTIENYFRASQFLILGIWVRRSGETEQFSKSIIRFFFSPQTEGHEVGDWKRSWNAQHAQACHLDLPDGRGKTEVPTSSQRVWRKVTKEGAGVRRAFAFVTAAQKPKTMETQPRKSRRKYFWSKSIFIQTINQVFH